MPITLFTQSDTILSIKFFKKKMLPAIENLIGEVVAEEFGSELNNTRRRQQTLLTRGTGVSKSDNGRGMIRGSSIDGRDSKINGSLGLINRRTKVENIDDSLEFVNVEDIGKS